MVHTVILKYSNLFSCELWHRHLGEYLPGLMVAERKSLAGINREFAGTTDHPALRPCKAG